MTSRILANRAAIVTGAGQGVGEGIARALAAEGAHVVVADINPERADAVAAEINGLAVHCDVTVEQDVASTVATTVKHFGTVDILVNNAMAQRPGVPLQDMSSADFDLAYGSGPVATFLFMRECFPYLRGTGTDDQSGGRIINLRSGAELQGLAGFGAYAAAKGAIAALTRVAAREWGVHGITVNAVAPFVLTEQAEQYFAAHPDELQGLLAQTSIPRTGNAQLDVGRAVVFLAGPDASYLTGCTLPVDGGGLIFS
ncbi:SDR family NAD(P)-dependent oxidoreductase [Streptomyces sp. NPDC059743]|uniref:SDR family NAD(P)-dependent oxidoreductase n=1 Tax=Streptomyces sp. NPDC059743 TaxID=3346928 RepID=UPI0036534124